MIITVQYFASLRETRGVSSEMWDTSQPTAEALYEELCQYYGFSLSKKHVIIAVNGEISSKNRTLQEGDEVAFLPPVSGG